MPAPLTLPQVIVALTVAFVLSNVSMLLLLGKHQELLDGFSKLARVLVGIDPLTTVASPPNEGDDAPIYRNDFYNSERPTPLYAPPRPLFSEDDEYDLYSPVTWQHEPQHQQHHQQETRGAEPAPLRASTKAFALSQ